MSCLQNTYNTASLGLYGYYRSREVRNCQENGDKNSRTVCDEGQVGGSDKEVIMGR